jgi:hypothetical protein
MDFFPETILGKDDAESESVLRSCSNCNSGIRTSEGNRCCINKTEVCRPPDFKFWTPVINFSGEFDETDDFYR